jgi:hypothetical protein
LSLAFALVAQARAQSATPPAAAALAEAERILAGLTAEFGGTSMVKRVMVKLAETKALVR